MEIGGLWLCGGVLWDGCEFSRLFALLGKYANCVVVFLCMYGNEYIFQKPMSCILSIIYIILRMHNYKRSHM